MNTTDIPAHYNHVMPYLIVKDAAGAMRFMAEVLGATEKMKHLRDDGHTVMHGEMTIGGSTIMLAEATDQYPPDTAGMFVYVPDADAAYQRALAMGATSIMPPADHPYGRSGGVKDPHGNTWWITTHTGQ
ncbi:VOC family protein [Nemorincola caseinilytica]|uniref:VOC family protein n=1 Tax=Nemorincola caseinilytica TaxID=2054315 RepID=A0ABP8N286_9BACT